MAKSKENSQKTAMGEVMTVLLEGAIPRDRSDEDTLFCKRKNECVINFICFGKECQLTGLLDITACLAVL